MDDDGDSRDDNYDPLDSEGDCFKPPAVPTRVNCLHCDEEYQSDLIVWRIERGEGGPHGFWCCPTPGCGGVGFGFDIFPVDPDFVDEHGEKMWQDFDEDEDGGEYAEEELAEGEFTEEDSDYIPEDETLPDRLKFRDQPPEDGIPY
jgi:hypothetical protein